MQEIQWQYYPHVAKNSIARAFIESQAKRQKRPKTIDAYARNLEDLIRTFANLEYADLIEAGPDLLEMYIDNLYHRAPARIRNKVTSQPGENLSPNTIHQRIVTARLFYDFCIYRGYRQDKTNPILRGSLGYGDTPPQKGVVSHKQRLPWIPSDLEWEALNTHVMVHESIRNQLMILLAYDGALRREELVSLRVDDFDWSRGVLTIRPETTKGGRKRYVPVSAYALHLVRQYIEVDRRALVAAF